jgi:hypothetical protein
VFQRGERFDFALVIDLFFSVSHSELSKGLGRMPIAKTGNVLRDAYCVKTFWLP